MRPTSQQALAAERADLRKALCLAMQEIRYLAKQADAWRAALARHDDNWRALKGLAPRAQPRIKGNANSARRRVGLVWCVRTYEIQERTGGTLGPKGMYAR